MTEVDYGGGGHRTRLKDLRDQLLCLWGAPSSIYKGGKEEGVGQEEEARPRGAILLQVGFATLSYSN